jgi:hypothetical protein
MGIPLLFMDCRINILKMTIIMKAIFRVNVFPIEIPISFFKK